MIPILYVQYSTVLQEEEEEEKEGEAVQLTQDGVRSRTEDSYLTFMLG